MPDTPEKSREEDFRDYSERNIDDGWPYADNPERSGRNAPYGEATDLPPAGRMEIAGDTKIDSSGGPSLLPVEEAGIVNDDELEAKITDRILESGRWGENQLTVSVRNGVATLEGGVETEAERQALKEIAMSTRGITNVSDRLRLTGVDSHIPPDADNG